MALALAICCQRPDIWRDNDLHVLPVGFTPGDVDLMDEANELPVPTERVDGDGYSLLFAGWWLVFVVLVLVLKSSRVLDFVRRIELNWTKT